MGITGLLPFLEKASRPCHVAEFRGCTVAIDAYCWLHKGAFGCAEKLVMGEDTNGYILYCHKYLKMLKSYDIHPILVFDGQHLPAKQLTEKKRREQRKSSKKKAIELLRIGKVDEARTHMRHSIDVTHKMALALIKECRENGIDCIVAPYEADAQLAYLNIKKFAHFVITEDSDLLLFGCNKILYKMDIQGFGILVEADKINLCMQQRPDNYSFDKFRYMCILSGCDYLESLPGIGLKKALKFVSMTANPSIYDVLLKLPSYLKLNNLIITNEYRESFMTADATFRHQLVFDPVKRKLLPLNDPKASGTKEEYCKQAGTMFDNNLAFEIALGNIDPLSQEKYDDWSPDMVSLARTSIWSRQYQEPNVMQKKAPKLVAPNMKNTQVDIQVVDQQKLEYDIKLEKELEIYKTMKHTPKKQEQEREETQTSDAAVSRPISVPFLKRLSRFQHTPVNYDEIFTSRFFSSKDNLPNIESTSNYDSLLSGISDCTKNHKSHEFKDAVCPNEGSSTKDLNNTKIEKCIEKFNKSSTCDISAKDLLSDRKKIIPDTGATVPVKTDEIENNVNIGNLQHEEIGDEVSESPQETDSTEPSKCVQIFSSDNIIHCNKRKQTTVLEGFAITKKKCLAAISASQEEDKQYNSALINVENQFVIISDNNADLTNTDNMQEFVPTPMSPVISSGLTYRRFKNMPVKVKTAKKQLDLRTMFSKMNKK